MLRPELDICYIWNLIKGRIREFVNKFITEFLSLKIIATMICNPVNFIGNNLKISSFTDIIYKYNYFLGQFCFENLETIIFYYYLDLNKINE